MKILGQSLTSLALGSLMLGVTSCGSKKAVQPSTGALQSRADSVAYAFGLLNAEGFKSRTSEREPISSLDRGMMARAFEQVLKGEPTLLTATQAEQIFKAYLTRYEEQIADKAKALEDSILQANKQKEGVQTTESGLQWKALRQGTGIKPTEQDTVVVHYSGRLHDGKEFDSSYKRGEPAKFPLSGVIKGWQEAVTMMSKGAKYELLIPSRLAYGARGAGDQIPAYSPLVFEIELLDVLPAHRQDEADEQPLDQKKGANPSKSSPQKRSGSKK